MKKYKILFCFFLCVFNVAYAKGFPKIFLFLGGRSAKQYVKYLKSPNIAGLQIVYSWKNLELNKDQYDFKKIQKDLKIVARYHKKLFIQIQDKSFSPKIIPVPNYLIKDKIYQGGMAKQIDFPGEGKKLTVGYVAKQWVPAVRQRFQKLLIKLAKQFDGKIYGINLPETAIDLDSKSKPKNFTCNKYFNSVLDNMKILKSSFKKSQVVQYVNFFPCEWNNDHHYMSRLFKYAIDHKIGLGNPDAIPYRRGQMKNSYPFFKKNKNKLSLVAIAIQAPDYTYTNPKTGKHFTLQQLANFETNYLGADIIFWNVQQPQLSRLMVLLESGELLKKG